MSTFWTWASIIGLSMTPSLVLGPSVAVGVGIMAHYDPMILIPVVAIAGFIEGLILVWIVGQAQRFSTIHRWISKLHTPRGMALAKKWGVWGGLSVGCFLVGQEPILLGLRWMNISLSRIWIPLAISNAFFTWLYYVLTSVSIEQLLINLQ
jgi:hypothetical protein